MGTRRVSTLAVGLLAAWGVVSCGGGGTPAKDPGPTDPGPVVDPGPAPDAADPGGEPGPADPGGEDTAVADEAGVDLVDAEEAMPVEDPGPGDEAGPGDPGGGEDPAPEDPGTPDPGGDDLAVEDPGAPGDDAGPGDPGAGEDTTLPDLGPVDQGPEDAGGPADVDAHACTSHDDCAGHPHGPCEDPRCDFQTGECVAVPIPGCVPEVCDNRVDDDGDFWIDCDDPQCAPDAACQGKPAGDHCGDPFLVNGGLPVDLSLVDQTPEYQGDTTTFHDDYTSFCAMEPEVPDVVYRFTLAVPMTVSVAFDFEGDDPQASPWPVVTLFGDHCIAQSFLDCSWGMEGPAVLDRALPPGTYHLVLDGNSYWYQDWGPYTLLVAFHAPPTAETVCDDGIDDDADGKTDCDDGDCAGTGPCQACPTKGHLACGQTVFGSLAAPEDRHYYTFSVDEATNVAFTMAEPPDYKDQLNLNFLEGPPTKPCDSLFMVSASVWHTTSPNAAGFAAKPGHVYVAKAFISETTFLTGDYQFTYTCNTEPESDCDDGQDNDVDALADCEDPDCFAACSGGHSGETCEDPFRVNGGQPVGLADLPPDGLSLLSYNTLLDKAGDLAASCAPVSPWGPDAVYRFDLEDTLLVNVLVEFDDFLEVPALILFAGSCSKAGLVGCGTQMLGLAYDWRTLDPGTYYVVVDSGAVGLDGKPDASHFTIEFWFDEPLVPEDCTNLVDDDEDGWTDCADPGCFHDGACTGGHSGEDCADPFLFGGGQPLAPGQAYSVRQTTVGRADDLAGPCSFVSQQGPDTAHRFVLDQAAHVEVQVRFDNGFTPALYVFKGTCAGTPLACTVADWDTATLSLDLDAGTHHVVVDSGDAFFMEPMAADYDLTLTVTTR